MRRGAAILFILLGTLWGADGVTAHARPTVPQIASVSDRNGAWEIYTMRPGGTDLRQLTDDDAYDFTPAWSPDGTRIAFVSDREGDWGIYTMRPDGTDVRRLTAIDERAEQNPAWSPDGTRIVFDSIEQTLFEWDDISSWSVHNIYTMRSDGTDVRQLTENGGHSPAWFR